MNKPNLEEAEVRDISAKRVALVGLGFLLFIFVSSALVGWMFRGRLLTSVESVYQNQISFPEPRPGAEIVDQLAKLHAQEEDVLTFYRAIDATTAQVPIERALKLAVEKHLLPQRGPDER